MRAANSLPYTNIVKRDKGLYQLSINEQRAKVVQIATPMVDNPKLQIKLGDYTIY